jgi:hypothetical protein
VVKENLPTKKPQPEGAGDVDHLRGEFSLIGLTAAERSLS